MPSRFRLIPVDVEALKVYDVETLRRAVLWTGGVVSESEALLIVPTTNGVLRVGKGDYVVKDSNGEFSVVPASDFEKTYEKL